MKHLFGKERQKDSVPIQPDNVRGIRKVDLSSVLDVAIEVWRLQDRFKKLQSTTGRQDPSITFSLEKIQHVLREIGIETRDYTGQTYNEGMSLDVLTFDYPVEQKPTNRVVQETVSPAIFFDGKLHKMAQVIVGKAGDSSDGAKHD
jgi:hypothetical protein